MTRAYNTTKRFSFTPDKIHLLKRLSKTHTQEEAAKVLGCSKYTIVRWAVELGAPFRKSGNNNHSTVTSEEDVELMRALYDEGVKQKDIADKFEVSQSYVSQIVNYVYRMES